MKTVSLLLLVMMFVSGCKTEVQGKLHDESFTYESAAHYPFVVGGVVSMIDTVSIEQHLLYSDILIREFIDERPEFTLYKTGRLIMTTSEAGYLAWMEDYLKTGEVRREFSKLIRMIYPNARYLVFCRIEENQVTQNHTENETDVADSDEDRKRGEYEYVQVDISLNSTRQVRATLNIYDLDQNITVWSGHIAEIKTHSNNFSRTFHKESRWRDELIDSFVGMMIGIDDQGYPEPPSLESLLTSVFEGFAENMPEKGRSL